MPTPEIQALWNRAIALHGASQFAEALDCLHTIEGKIGGHAGLLENLGVVYRDAGDLGRAEEYLRRACATRPQEPAAHFNLALALLRAGKLREGFREYEWRWRVPQFAPQRREFAQPLWRGEPLGGKRILLYGEQGAGDTLQFARYAPLVRAAGGEPILEVLPHVERLFHGMVGEYPIVNALTAAVAFDLQCPLMSLPERFGTELTSIPPPATFSLPAGLREKWAAKFEGGRRNIGLVWAGNRRHANDAARSIPPKHYEALARLPGIRCWSLQVGGTPAEIPAGVEDLAPELADFAETAAAIQALDLVITVDTAAAHLAGSLAKPVWLLLPYTSDWRWLAGRDDSPWYPSMRLIRQKRPGDWRNVMERTANLIGAGIV